MRGRRISVLHYEYFSGLALCLMHSRCMSGMCRSQYRPVNVTTDGEREESQVSLTVFVITGEPETGSRERQKQEKNKTRKSILTSRLVGTLAVLTTIV